MPRAGSVLDERRQLGLRAPWFGSTWRSKRHGAICLPSLSPPKQEHPPPSCGPNRHALFSGAQRETPAVTGFSAGHSVLRCRFRPKTSSRCPSNRRCLKFSRGLGPRGGTVFRGRSPAEIDREPRGRHPSRNGFFPRPQRIRRAIIMISSFPISVFPRSPVRPIAFFPPIRNVRSNQKNPSNVRTGPPDKVSMPTGVPAPKPDWRLVPAVGDFRWGATRPVEDAPVSKSSATFLFALFFSALMMPAAGLAKRKKPFFAVPPIPATTFGRWANRVSPDAGGCARLESIATPRPGARGHGRGGLYRAETGRAAGPRAVSGARLTAESPARPECRRSCAPTRAAPESFRNTWSSRSSAPTVPESGNRSRRAVASFHRDKRRVAPNLASKNSRAHDELDQGPEDDDVRSGFERRWRRPPRIPRRSLAAPSYIRNLTIGERFLPGAPCRGGGWVRGVLCPASRSTRSSGRPHWHWRRPTPPSSC